MSTATLARPPGALIRLAERLGLFAGCLAAWQLLAAYARNSYFPTPTTILRKAGELWFTGPASSLWLTESVFSDILPSLGRLLFGWTTASMLGIVLGLLLGRSTKATDYVGSLLAFARGIPAPTLVPVFLVLFQIGTQMELATIIFGVVWPVLLNSIDGARAADSVKEDIARAFKVPRWHRVLYVIVPAALPRIFAGLRISLSIALILMVIAELVGATTSGIGYQLLYAQGRSDLPGMWAWIVLTSMLGYVLNSLLLVLERRMLGWHRAATRQLEV